MSAAAKEMTNPPREILGAKIALAAQATMGMAYVMAAVNIADKAQVTAALYFGSWLFHLVACVLVGIAAHRMQRQWLRYMSWQVGIPFGGPLMSLMDLHHFRDSRE